MQLILAALLAGAPAVHRPQLPPVDQCTSLPGFAAFRTKLAAAITRKDGKALLAMTDPDIDISFGGDSGQAAFAKAWALERPATSPVWAELGEMLRLGCATDGSVATMPALSSLLPEDYDVFETMVAVKPGSPLRAKPAEGAKTVTTLNWDILQVGDWDGRAAWIPVKLPDGRKGFVRKDEVRSPGGYRATFERVRGGWKITTFLEGD
jgi:hypothetical protein